MVKDVGIDPSRTYGQFSKITPAMQVALSRRDKEAVTFAFFQREIGDLGNPKFVEAIIRRRISSAFTQNYMNLLGGSVVSGMSELAVFEDLSATFPQHDLPLLSEVASVCGLVNLLDWDRVSQDDWDYHLFLRGDLLFSEFASVVRWIILGFHDFILSGRRPQLPTDRWSIRGDVRTALRQWIPSSRRLGSALASGDAATHLEVARSHLEATVGRLLSVGGQLGASLERCRPMSLTLDVDVVIMTVNKIETAAFRKGMETLAGKPSTKFGGVNVYEVYPAVGGVVVAHTISGMGSGKPTGSMLTAYDAVLELRPRIVIGVGVAFGRDATKQPVGRVLVSESISAYDAEKVGEQSIPRGPARLPASAMLVSRFRAIASNRPDLDIQFGEVMSGDKLVDNYQFKSRLFDLFPEAIGGEMEASGIYSSCDRVADAKVHWLIVKGICDYGAAKSTQKEERQVIAADRAAEVLLAVLSQGGFAEAAILRVT
jgi:nucleoside phosphorylase